MRGFAPTFYRLALANFFLFLGNSLFLLLPVFFKDLGASESYIGFMNNVDKVFVILTAFLIGSFMQGRDRITLFRAGLIVLLAAFPAYLLIDGLDWLVLAVRVLHGVGFALAMILGTTIIFDIVPPDRAAEAIGFYGITGALSNAVSPLAGETLLSLGFPHGTLFALSTVLVALSLGVAMTLGRGPSARSEGDTPRGGTLALLADGRFALVSVMTFIFGGLFGLIITYLPNFVRETTDMGFSLFFIVYIATLVAVRFTVMARLSRVNLAPVLGAMFVTGTLTHLLMHVMRGPAVLCSAGVLYGLTHGVLYPVLNALSVSVVSDDRRGAANALFTAVFSGGMLAVAAGAGRAVDRAGSYLAAFDIGAALGMTGLAVLAWMVLKYGVPGRAVREE